MAVRSRSLNFITNQRELHILGCNSGTSADGLDFALVRLSFKKRSSLPKAKYMAGHSEQFSPAMRDRILNIADHPDPPLSEVLALDAELGEIIGRSAVKVLSKLRKAGHRIDAICSHGQTVRHLPNQLRIGSRTASATCQLGSLERIAAHTQMIVVGDVRQGDIATGGEGAPITVAAMKILFGDSRESRLIVNIGGISNYFWLPAGASWEGISAADCGPGNVLIDQLTQLLFERPYDANGRLASKGVISDALLNWSIDRSRKNSRSTGREAFGPQFLASFVKRGRTLKLDDYDLLATATELTAQMIASGLRPIISSSKSGDSPTRLSLTGGGGRNSFLVSRLRQAGLTNTSGVPLGISFVDELGIPGAHVEAAAYAVMGGATLLGFPLPTSWTKQGKVAAAGAPGRIVQPSERIGRS